MDESKGIGSDCYTFRMYITISNLLDGYRRSLMDACSLFSRSWHFFAGGVLGPGAVES